MHRFRTASLLGMIGLLAVAAPQARLQAASQEEPVLVAIPVEQAAAPIPTATKGPSGAPKATKLKVDDGTLERVIGMMDSAQTHTLQTVFLNRFTPPEDKLPLAVDTVQIRLPERIGAADSGLRGDMKFEVLVYLDPTGSGDPAYATLALRQEFVINPHDTISQAVKLAEPVTVASGDVWIGYTNSVSATGEKVIWHGALDTSSGSKGRSWLFYNRGSDGFTGDDLSAADYKKTIDEMGYPGNWLIRAKGKAPRGVVEL